MLTERVLVTVYVVSKDGYVLRQRVPTIGTTPTTPSGVRMGERVSVVVGVDHTRTRPHRSSDQQMLCLCVITMSTHTRTIVIVCIDEIISSEHFIVYPHPHPYPLGEAVQ